MEAQAAKLLPLSRVLNILSTASARSDKRLKSPSLKGREAKKAVSLGHTIDVDAFQVKHVALVWISLTVSTSESQAFQRVFASL